MVNGLDADKIEFENPFSGNDGDLLEIEGNISSVTTSTDFVVNGVVRVDASGAVFENGTKTDVFENVEVEVKGTIENRSGESVLVAREVEFEVEDDARIEAFVDSIDAAANTLNVLGIMVEYSDNTLDTEFEDKSGAPAIGTVDGLDPSNNDWVRVEANIDSSGNLFASRIERDNDDADDTRVILKGPASDTPSSIPAFPGPFTILGVNVVEGTGVEYRLGEDTPIDRTTFFNNLSNGRPVKARGSYLSGTLTAERLELDD
jgi:hypothetical protein